MIVGIHIMRKELQLKISKVNQSCTIVFSQQNLVEYGKYCQICLTALHNSLN